MAANSKDEKGSHLEKVGEHFQVLPWRYAKITAAKHGLRYFVMFIKVSIPLSADISLEAHFFRATVPSSVK